MRVLIFIMGIVLYPLGVHWLVLQDRPLWAVSGLVVTSLFYLGLGLATARRGKKRLWLGAYALLIVAGIGNLLTHSVYALYLPPVLINLGLMAFFAASLRTGSVPLVERLVRLAYQETGQDLPAVLAESARRLTWMWIFFFAAMLLVSLVLAYYGPLARWSLFVNVWYFVLLALMILGQHLYRYLRFRDQEVGSLRIFIRNISRVSLRDPIHPFYLGGGTPSVK